MIISQKCEIINLNKSSQNYKSELIFVADECFRVPQHIKFCSQMLILFYFTNKWAVLNAHQHEKQTMYKWSGLILKHSHFTAHWLGLLTRPVVLVRCWEIKEINQPENKYYAIIMVDSGMVKN